MEQEEKRSNLNSENWKNFRYGIAVRKNKNYRKAIRQLQGAYFSNRVLNSKLYNELKDARLLLNEYKKQVSEQRNEIKRVMNLDKKNKKWWHLW